MVKKRKRPSLAQDPESLAWLGVFGVGFVGYFAAEFGLAGQPHPLHWLVMGLAGLAGFVGGRSWPTIRAWATRDDGVSTSRRHDRP